MSKLSYVTTAELERLRMENEESARARAEAEEELRVLRSKASQPPMVAAARARILVTAGCLVSSEDAGDPEAFKRYMRFLRRELMDLEVAEVMSRDSTAEAKVVTAVEAVTASDQPVPEDP